jgi:penicillin-binding protein 1C
MYILPVFLKIKLVTIKYKYCFLAIFILSFSFWFSLPATLFNKPYSLVLLDKEGKLIQAKIAKDNQWRFPIQQNISNKFKQAVIAYEDKRFYHHSGIDFIALSRAIKQNIIHKKIISGGSTISMQLIRLSRNKPRNIYQKIIEMILTFRLELSYSKDEILALYIAHAPFGGNVVGLEAASWRYFARSANDLSWGEAASLAILPNAPALVHPGKNRELLKAKRNKLLDKLFALKIIDKVTCELSKLEPIPDAPIPLPQYAPHLINTIQQDLNKQKNNNKNVIQTTLNLALQKSTNEILLRHHERLVGNNVNNAAAMIMEIESGNVLAYIGNIYKPKKADFESYVDIIKAPRSPGSTLKPILYEAMLHDGLILPNTLIADIPTQIAGYAPQNFDLEYDGAVPANKALARSLNVPAIRMLNLYRYERFYYLLKKLGISSLKKPAQHYGLSLILGGGENSMWQIAGVYSSMARVLNNYANNSGKYNEFDIHEPTYIKKQNPKISNLSKEFFISASSIYSTFEAMEEVMRPGEEGLWSQFTSSQRIAWKTGTSFGFRDAWAVGLTPKFLVVVWVGNADGEGRPGLTGINTAAPILFDIFRTLPASNWFDLPYDEMLKTAICKQSGYKATELCEIDSIYISKSGNKTMPCPYHQIIHTDATGKFRVNSDCESINNMNHQSYFILPPSMEFYYKKHNATYKELPEWRNDCKQNTNQQNPIEMIYPKRSNKIFIPLELNGIKGKVVFKAAHSKYKSQIFWHIDGVYIGQTNEIHQMALFVEKGIHLLVLVDDEGNRLEQNFEVINN